MLYRGESKCWGSALQYCRGGIGIHFLDTIQPGRANAPLAPLNAAWCIISKGRAVTESVTQYVATRSDFNYILHVAIYKVWKPVIHVLVI